LKRIQDAYLGSLSYFNSLEKASYLESQDMNLLEAGDTQGYFDTLYKQLEYEKKMSTTKEQYALDFDTYVSELKNAEYEPKTTDDVVKTLEELIEQNKRIEDAIEMSSFQKPLTTP
jgi:hypothetical protein